MADTILTEINQIDEAWILSKMKELGLKRKHLRDEIGLSANYMSLLFADKDNPRKIGLSIQTRAMFYYYLRFKEMSHKP